MPLNPGGQVDLPVHRLELLGLDPVDAILLGLEDLIGQVARGVALDTATIGSSRFHQHGTVAQRAF